MSGIIGEFRLGEDISVALDAVSGDPASVSAVNARIKSALVCGNRFVLDDTATGTDMQVTAQSPASAGWVASLSHSATVAFNPGVYGIDARLTIGGAVEMTDQTAFIRLTRAAVA